MSFQIAPLAGQHNFTIGRRDLEVVRRVDEYLNVRWTLVEADGTEWDLVATPRRAGKSSFSGDRVAVNRETGKRLMRSGKVARFYAHNGILYQGLN